MGPFFKPTFLPMAKLLGRELWENPYVFRSLFILKIPYLLLDIATGILIAKLVAPKI